MAKKSQTKEFKVDLTKPFNKEDLIVDSDCYGKEYDPAANECAVCSVHEMCGIIRTEAVKKMGKQIKRPTENYVDEWNFDLVPTVKLLTLFKANPKQYTTEQILEVIREKSKCEDEKTCVQWLINFFKANNVGTDNGKIFIKDA